MTLRGLIERGLWLAVMALAGLAPCAGADVTAAGDLRLVSIGSFSQPTYVAAAPGDARRVFVVEKGGTVRVVRDGTLLPDPFLTVPSVHDDGHGEQGLLSIAFAPDYATSRRFYVFYSDATACDASGVNCDIRIDEFRRSARDADHADPATRRKVLSVGHRLHPDHNGGQLQFGPDGMLYLATGDGGGDGDPQNNAQNRNSLLGKLLRINPVAAAAPYSVPASNPFYGRAPSADAVWAYGLRNPWRFSFDHLTGDLAVADVGQDAHEEVDFQPRGQGRGANYGWSLFEGFHRYSGTVTPSDYVPPVLSYDHVDGNCAIIGGYVSRDRTVPRLAGRYVYGDLCTGRLRSAILAPGAALDDAAIGDPGNPATPALTVTALSSFGEDSLCRIYAVSFSGPVYRIEAAPSPGPPGCVQTPLVVSRVSLLHRTFAVAPGPPTPSGARRGTFLHYTLSAAAIVHIWIEHALPGREVGGRCRPASRTGSGNACTRFLRIGALTRRAHAGANTTRFTGRIGTRPLRAGHYRALLSATDGTGNAAPKRSVAFTVVTG